MMRIQATQQLVEDYQKLLVNRRAYTMQSLRPHPETGRHYYFRPSKKGTDLPDSFLSHHFDDPLRDRGAAHRAHSPKGLRHR